MDSQELRQLEYSQPVCRWESTGTITNAQGQKLEINARGKDPILVEQYMRSVRISFIVLPEGENAKVWDEPSEPRNDKYDLFIEEEFKKLKLFPELGLEIELDVTDTPGLEPPYDLNIEIDPDISGGVPHNYRTKKKSKKEKVTLKASVNGVYGVLSGGGITPVPGQADVIAPDPPKNSAKFTGEADTDSDFFFTVTGLLANNTYSISASIKLLKQ
jgi:hypothetical protein